MRLRKSSTIVTLLISVIAASIVVPCLNPTRAQDGSDITEFTSGDIRFVYPTAFATSITEIPIEAVPYDPELPIFAATPVYTQFVFEGFPTLTDGFSIPIIDIYPTADFEAFTVRDDDPFGYGIELENLTTMLTERPDLALYTDPSTVTTRDALTLPFLPPPYAGQVFRSQAAYIPFDDGWGIRYLAYYTQGIAEVREQDLMYTFQGVSNDGSTYISVSFPIVSGLLPTEYDPDLDPETFADNYTAYMQRVTAMLNKQDPALFDPTLTLLDAIILSLSINGTLDYIPTPEATTEPSAGG